MYERSAIVLERYFNNLLDYSNECNLRDNFNNYCNIVEKLEKYQLNYQKELVATREYNECLRKIKNVQFMQKELYNKSAKLEYNRNLLFNNIDGKIEDTRKCIEKIENDVASNNEAMKETKEKLLKVLGEYNEKRFELSKCKRYKKMAENDYNEILEISRKNFEGINQENVNKARAFAKFEDNEDIVETLLENGKNEKIPFNEDVIKNATRYAIDITKKETVCYIVIYEKMTKLLSDIDSGTTKINLHKKYVRNEKAKIDFLLAVKDYIVQFLDYERMTVIHGRKSHNRLMSEACENFNTDIVQIDNLFDLLVRETTNKATKKAYKELYNKSYLIDIKEKEEKFKKEKNRVNLNTATLINSNYWRIEGIRNIYTIFYKNVSEVFGRDVVEFDIPKEFDEYINEENEESVSEENEDIEDVEEEKVYAKIPFAISENGELDDEEYEDYEDDEEKEEEEDDDDDDSEDEEYNEEIDTDFHRNTRDVKKKLSSDDEFDIFGEKYKEIDFSDNNLVAAKSKIEKDIGYNRNNYNDEIKDNIFREVKFEDDEGYYGIKYENEEEQLFEELKQAKNNKKNSIEDFNVTKEEKKNTGVFKRLRKINNVKKNSNTEDVW